MKPPVTLIIPPSAFLADERVFVSLGILKVAACLERAHHDVRVLDLSGINNYTDVVTSYMRHNKECRIYGITTTSPQMPAVKQICDVLGGTDGENHIIIGGPHVTMVSAAYKREQKQGVEWRATREWRRLEKLARVLVAGDGEDAIHFAILPDASRFIDGDDPEGAYFLQAEKLHEYPYPARHLVDLTSYKYQIDGEPACSLIMQLGCNYGCVFCGGRLTPSFRRTRIRIADNVISEIRSLYQTYGLKGYFFLDDELNINPRMVNDLRMIGGLQEELGVEFKLRGFIKSNLFTEEQAKVMREVGFRQVLIGFESGSDRILTNIQKKATKAQNTRCMEIAYKYGLKVKALMSIGHAGESEQTITDTHDWLLEVKPFDFDCTVITTYPGTPYHDFAIPDGNIWVYTAKNGDKLYETEMDYSESAKYYKGIPGQGYTSYVHTDYLGREDLVRMRDWVEKDVRNKLNIPFYAVTAGAQFEASMGQLPGYIYRSSQQEQQ